MNRTLGLVGLLALAGAAWGATQPLTKIAVSEGYRHFGLLVWQNALGTAILGVILLARRKPIGLSSAKLVLFTVVALTGSVLPGIASYNAARHLPSGILSILLSTVPMFAYPVALAMANDQFRWRRLLGLTLGLCGVSLLVLPGTALPDPALWVWIPIALIASAFYGFEGNYVARFGTESLDPVQVLFGASLIATLVSLPLALASGQFIDPRGPWGAPDHAIIVSAFLHIFAYTAYVWLVGQAGSVFAAQVSYMVTFFGVIWAMLFLAERYTGYVWAAFAVMMAGLFFVTPRPRALGGRDRGQSTAGSAGE